MTEQEGIAALKADLRTRAGQIHARLMSEAPARRYALDDRQLEMSRSAAHWQMAYMQLETTGLTDG